MEISAKTGFIAQKHNKHKKSNKFTWGISTVGSGAFALLGA